MRETTKTIPIFGLVLGIPPEMGWCHYYDHVDHESPPDLVTTSLQDAMNSFVARNEPKRLRHQRFSQNVETGYKILNKNKA